MTTSTYFDSAEAIKARWWKEKSDLHHTLFALVKLLDTRQAYRSGDNLHCLKLYANFEAVGLTVDKYARTRPVARERDKLSLNVARSIVDTVHSRIIQDKTKPTFITSGGDASAQRKAKLTDKLVGGMFYHGRAYLAGQETCKHAEIFGTGVLKTIASPYDGQPTYENVFIDDVLVDEVEGYRRRPRQMFQRSPVDRDQLVDLYPKKAAELKDAGMPESISIRRNTIGDQVTVVDAWRLPTRPGAGDGRHVVACNNVTLLDEKWEYDYFPFHFLRWSERTLGFYGQGICEQVSGLQYEINTLLRKAQEQMRLAGPKVFLERGSNVNTAHIDNEIWGIVEYSGIEPKHVVFNSVEPSLFQHLEWLYEKAFADAGVSQLAAQAKKPAGLNSGKAILTFSDIEDTRLIAFTEAYQSMYLDAAERSLDIARKTHLKPDDKGKKKSFVVTFANKTRGRRFLEKINWADINLEKDDYVIQAFPTSLLPSTPSGKLQAVGEMMDRGMLQGDQAVALLDFPDLERVTSLVTAAIDDVDMMLENMLEHGIPQTVEPGFSNLQLCVSRMTSAYLRAKNDKVPEKNLELVRRFIESAQAEIAKATPPPQAPSMGAPALPQGVAPPPAPVAGAPGMGMPG